MLKRIGIIAVFLFTAILSFFITKDIIKGRVNEPPISEDSISGPNPEEETDTFVIDTEGERDTIVEMPKEIVLKVSTPIVNDDNNYSFRASFSGEVGDPYHYELWSNEGIVQRSKQGSFINVPEGEYRLCLVSDVTGKSIVPYVRVRAKTFVNEPQKLISESDFQNRMLDRTDRTLNGGRKSFVTKDFRLEISNAVSLEGDFNVSDIQDVRDMIYTYGKWKSARVIELQYNSQGRVTVAKIEPVY